MSPKWLHNLNVDNPGVYNQGVKRLGSRGKRDDFLMLSSPKYNMVTLSKPEKYTRLQSGANLCSIYLIFSFTPYANFGLFLLKVRCQTCGQMGYNYTYLIEQKTMWENKKLLVTSNFFLPHNVFKSCRLLMRQNENLWSKGLIVNFLKF